MINKSATPLRSVSVRLAPKAFAALMLVIKVDAMETNVTIALNVQQVDVSMACAKSVAPLTQTPRVV